MSSPYDYKVLIDAPEPSTPCKCGGCDWRGKFSELADIEDCILNPGDPSPAGRCPLDKCQSLAYLATEKARIIENALIMLNALHTISRIDPPTSGDRAPSRYARHIALSTIKQITDG